MSEKGFLCPRKYVQNIIFRWKILDKQTPVIERIETDQKVGQECPTVAQNRSQSDPIAAKSPKERAKKGPRVVKSGSRAIQ